MTPQMNASNLELPLDIVVKILVSVHHTGDWNKSLDEHFPKRKGWVLKDPIINS